MDPKWESLHWEFYPWELHIFPLGSENLPKIIPKIKGHNENITAHRCAVRLKSIFSPNNVLRFANVFMNNEIISIYSVKVPRFWISISSKWSSSALALKNCQSFTFLLFSQPMRFFVRPNCLRTRWLVLFAICDFPFRTTLSRLKTSFF